MSVTRDDSCNAGMPSFKKSLEAALSKKKQIIENSLAKDKDLDQPSLADREKAYYDLHGVADAVEEKPGFVDKCLADLESEICRLEDNKDAYEMAKKVNPEYVCGRGFRLKFLRAGCFVPKDAAARLVGFLEEKFQLFGPKPLARELLLSDLNQEDMVVVRSGFFSIVPLKDSAGRAITVVSPFFRQEESTLKIRMRAVMYLISAFAQDEETQRKGCVGIFMNMKPFRRPTGAANTVSITNLMGNLAPIRYVGYHFCNDEDPRKNMISSVKPTEPPSAHQQATFLRLRFHSGSLLDVHHDLMTFGIPTKVLPVTAQGEADWQHHYSWISSRKSIEAKKLEANEVQPTPSIATNKDDRVDVPRAIDVLMGRGMLSRSHTGNTRYHFLIDAYQERYDTCETSIEKTIIAAAIVMKVREYGGRFLLRNKGETNWTEADDWVAREKVTNAFRGRRKSAAARLKKRSNDDTDTSKRRRLLPPLSRSPVSDPNNIDDV